MKRSRSLIVLMTVAILLFAFAGLVVAAEQDDAATRLEGFGVIEGYPDGTMGLEREITRAEFAKIAVVAKGLEEAADLLKGNASQFTDVQTNVWYTGWVNVANAQGIVKGDPVGTFRPNDNITVAESVAMILRTLGYNDNLPGAWPTNYLVKGAALEVTTGVVTNANAKALRGDVFTMLNRALDEDIVLWGSEDKSDDADFNKKGYTLLQEMKNAKEKTEGRITANARTNDRYKADEVYITIDKDDKNHKGNSGKFVIKSGDSVDYLLGLEVELFHNKDDEVYNVKVKTKDSDIIYDSVVTADTKEVELDVEDDTFRWEDGVKTAFVNFETEDVEDLKKGYYGKFVMDGKRVVFASVFDFANDIGVVTKIDGDVIDFIAGDATDRELDLDDADELVILTPEFKAADQDDIKKNSAIFYWSNDDDEYYVVVKNEMVEGKVDSIQKNKARINGKNYDKAADAVITTDGDDFYVWRDLSEIEDLDGEEVVAVLDLNGDILLISGDADSKKMYGVVTYADLARNGEITVLNADGKEVTYKFEKRNDLAKTNIEYVKGNFDYYGNVKAGGNLKYAVASFKLNKNGEVREDTFTVASVDKEVKGSVEVIGDKNVHEIKDGNASKKVDDKFIQIGGDNGTRYYIDNNTVIFKTIDKTDKDLDPGVQKNADIIKSSFTSESAIVFVEDGKRDAKMIVFLGAEFEGTADDSYFGVVTANPEKSGDDWKVDIDVFGEGKKNYVVDDHRDFSKGNLVEFRIKSNGDASIHKGNKVVLDKDTVSKEVKVKRSGYLEIKGESKDYKLENSAVVYEEDNAGKRDLGKRRSASAIGAGDSILYILENEDVIKAAILLKAPGTTTDPEVPEVPEVQGTVTYISAAADPSPAAFKIEVEGKIYTVNANTVLRNELGVIEDDTITEVWTRLYTTLGVNKAQVFDIVANASNEISSFKYVALKADKDAAKTVIDLIDALGANPTEAKVEVARYAYDGTAVTLGQDVTAITPLTAGAQRNLVTNLVKLVAAETKIADAAQEILDGQQVKADITAATDNATIKAARTDYTALTALGKAEVDNLAVLVGKETALADAKTSLVNKLAAATALYNQEAATLNGLTQFEKDAITVLDGSEPAAYTGLVSALNSARITANGFDATVGTETATTINAAANALDTPMSDVTTAKAAFDALVAQVK